MGNFRHFQRVETTLLLNPADTEACEALWSKLFDEYLKDGDPKNIFLNALATCAAWKLRDLPEKDREAGLIWLSGKVNQVMKAIDHGLDARGTG